MLNNILLFVTILIDPLEQFEFTMVAYLSIFNSFMWLFFINIFVMILFMKLSNNINIFSYIFNKLFSLLKEIFISTLGLKNQAFFYFYMYLFMFILINNIIGMIAYAHTITSFFVITFFCSFILIGGILIIAFEKNRFAFLSIFYPKGIPVIIKLLLIQIELISYIMRLFSLSIRLFANMVAGHALLKILLSFLWISLTAINLLSCISILLWVLILVITVLEILIAFLQAYVFTFLGMIYLSEVLK